MSSNPNMSAIGVSFNEACIPEEDSSLIHRLETCQIPTDSDAAANASNSEGKSTGGDDVVWESFNTTKLIEREEKISKWRGSDNVNSLPVSFKEEEDENDLNEGLDNEKVITNSKISNAHRWERRLRVEVFDGYFVSHNKDINDEIEELCLSFGFRRTTKHEVDTNDSDSDPDRKSGDLKQLSADPLHKEGFDNGDCFRGSFGPATEKQLLDRLKEIASRQVVILRQGPILFDDCDIFHEADSSKDHELIVLTEGFVICEIKKQEEKILRKIKHCDEIRNIVSVIDLGYTDIDGMSSDNNSSTSGIQIIVQGCSYAFSNVDSAQKQSWIRTLEFAIVNQEKYMETKKDIGWQHLIMRTSIHSAAWIGDDEMLDIILESSDGDTSLVDLPDADGFSAIHYAILQKNLACLTLLLEAGCDPNKLSSQFKSPATYCEFGGNADEDATLLNDMLKLLKEYGSKEADSILKKNERKSRSLRYTMSRMVVSFRKRNDQMENMNLRSSDTISRMIAS